MAERKSGPVKPPVIDLTARPAEPDKPEARPAPGTQPPPADRPTAAEATKEASPRSAEPSKPAAAAKPETKPSHQPPRDPLTPNPQPPAPRPRVWPAAAGGAIAGAVIAVAVCYGLAYQGLWPATSTDARIDQLQSRLDAAEKSATATTSGLAAVNTRLDGLGSELTAKLGDAGGKLAAMQQNLDALQAAKPPAVDLAPLQAQVKALSSRLDAVAAGASSADAGAIAANLATAQRTLGDLGNKVAAIDTHIQSTDSTVTALKGELDSARAAIDQAARAPSPKAIASAMQLPLLISALESDFAAGRPYATDLGNLVAAVPETHVPASVSDAAAAGLPAPGELARAFDAAVPEILGARPPGTDTSWQGQMADWVKGVLALRPQGEIAGDAPDAVLSRLQAAVDRHDFAGAAKLLAQLPPAMQAAAGELAGKIKALADADAFVAALRSTALAPAAGAQK